MACQEIFFQHADFFSDLKPIRNDHAALQGSGCLSYPVFSRLFPPFRRHCTAIAPCHTARLFRSSWRRRLHAGCAEKSFRRFAGRPGCIFFRPMPVMESAFIRISSTFSLDIHRPQSYGIVVSFLIQKKFLTPYKSKKFNDERGDPIAGNEVLSFVHRQAWPFSILLNNVDRGVRVDLH